MYTAACATSFWYSSTLLRMMLCSVHLTSVCMITMTQYTVLNTLYSMNYTQYMSVRLVRASSNIYCTCPQDIMVKWNIHRSCRCKILIQQNRMVPIFCSSICTIDSGAVGLHTVSRNSSLMSHLVCECNPLF